MATIVFRLQLLLRFVWCSQALDVFKVVFAADVDCRR
jgi:hypothetical protein